MQKQGHSGCKRELDSIGRFFLKHDALKYVKILLEEKLKEQERVEEMKNSLINGTKASN